MLSTVLLHIIWIPGGFFSTIQICAVNQALTVLAVEDLCRGAALSCLVAYYRCHHLCSCGLYIIPVGVVWCHVGVVSVWCWCRCGVGVVWCGVGVVSVSCLFTHVTRTVVFLC